MKSKNNNPIFSPLNKNQIKKILVDHLIEILNFKIIMINIKQFLINSYL